jgi:hypothetical protein
LLLLLLLDLGLILHRYGRTDGWVIGFISLFKLIVTKGDREVLIS